MHPFRHSGFANLLSNKSFFLLFTFTFHQKHPLLGGSGFTRETTKQNNLTSFLKTVPNPNLVTDLSSSFKDFIQE